VLPVKVADVVDDVALTGAILVSSLAVQMGALFHVFRKENPHESAPDEERKQAPALSLLLEPLFRNVVAMSGNTIVAGSLGTKDQGQAYVFVEPAGGWQDAQPTATLTPSNGNQLEAFGHAVAISGNTVVVGASGYPLGKAVGAAYVFVEPAGGWVDMTQTAELSIQTRGLSDLGWSVAIENDVVLAGDPEDTIGRNQGQGIAPLRTSSRQAGGRTPTRPTRRSLPRMALPRTPSAVRSQSARQ
jgi:hypothetical protein